MFYAVTRRLPFVVFRSLSRVLVMETLRPLVGILIAAVALRLLAGLLIVGLLMVSVLAIRILIVRVLVVHILHRPLVRQRAFIATSLIHTSGGRLVDFRVNLRVAL